ncbi:DUF5919 domain-containing protein [Micromonospora carbonacea]|uniref:Helix-turn-helix domain-containing protein n=1 Tax=Micromonospora carbonacea TaxID=47853 RepID=A0A1C4W0C6_9ACTN|nr:Helix-turn-helix domain-containing protein [Micromonospora carbonacea]
MATVQRWSGRESRTLRHALRMSIRDFAAHLGVAERTVSKWEAGGAGVTPRPEMQAALDTTLGKASVEARDRFTATLRATSAAGASPSPALPLGAPGTGAEQLGDLVAVFSSRTEFSTHVSSDHLLGGARTVRAVGLSLNLLTQGFADSQWHGFVRAGGRARCLFLDPAGAAVEAREAEEGFAPGQLSALTRLNIETLVRVRARLPDGLGDHLELAVYDDTLRFNVVLTDDVCVAQPYLPVSRGVDSPTFVVRRQEDRSCLYPVFEQFFESQWQRGRQL